MDGVLVDFNSVRPNASNLNHPSQELSEQDRELKRQFWLNIEKQDNFWAEIPMMKDIKNVLDIAKSMGELFILSKTPGAKHFIGGQNYVNYVADEKRKWVLKNLGQYFDDNHIIICDGNKGELINPSSEDILVDDRNENIIEWESHNGRGILFINSDDAVKKLKELN